MNTTETESRFSLRWHRDDRDTFSPQGRDPSRLRSGHMSFPHR